MRNELKEEIGRGPVCVYYREAGLCTQNPILHPQKDTSVGHVNPHLGKMNGVL